MLIYIRDLTVSTVDMNTKNHLLSHRSIASIPYSDEDPADLDVSLGKGASESKLGMSL